MGFHVSTLYYIDVLVVLVCASEASTFFWEEVGNFNNCEEMTAMSQDILALPIGIPIHCSSTVKSKQNDFVCKPNKIGLAVHCGP